MLMLMFILLVYYAGVYFIVSSFWCKPVSDNQKALHPPFTPHFTPGYAATHDIYRLLRLPLTNFLGDGFTGKGKN